MLGYFKYGITKSWLTSQSISKSSYRITFYFTPSSSTVSQTYLNRHIRSGFVNRHTHFIRNGDYITANGDVVNAEVWQLPSMTMGPKTIYNVEIAVMPGIEETGFLLGMSTINKLGKPKIDLTNNKIIIN